MMSSGEYSSITLLQVKYADRAHESVELLS